jgi:hypothetical protein
MFPVQVKSIPGVKFFFAFVKLESVLPVLISVEFSKVSLVYTLQLTWCRRDKERGNNIHIQYTFMYVCLGVCGTGVPGCVSRTRI